MSDDQENVDVVLEEENKEENKEPVVEIAEETPIEAAKQEEPPEIKPEEGISELKKRLEAEKNARAEAERRAYEAQKRVQQAHGDVHEANYQLVVNAIETVKERGEAFKRAYAEAMTVGDYERGAQIQEAIAVNATQLAELKRGKKAMKAEKEKLEAQPVQPMPRSADVVEQMAQSVSPRSASWLRDNKSALAGEREIRKMFRAHEDAIDDGIEPDSDRYFEFIETRLGLRQRHHDVADEGEDSPLSSASAPTAPRRSAPPPPPAPVSRGNGRPNVYRLTKEQAEMAKMLGMSDTEYAKQRIALQKEGKL